MNKSRFVKWHGETVQKGSASGPNQHAAAGESAANEQVLPFEGEGYTEVGTIRRDEDFDDEFDYAFEGQNREGAVHQQIFQGKPMPAHLVAHVREEPLNMVHEDEEGEEEEEEEEGIVVDEGSTAEHSSHPQLDHQFRDGSHSEDARMGEEDGLGSSRTPCSSGPSHGRDVSVEDDEACESGEHSNTRLGERGHTSQNMHNVLRDVCEYPSGPGLGRASRGHRPSVDGSRGSGWSTFVASEGTSQPAGQDAEANTPHANDLFIPDDAHLTQMPSEPSEELPSLKLLKKLSQEEHKLNSLQEAGPSTPGSGGFTAPKPNGSSGRKSLEQPSFSLGSIFDRLSPSRKSPMLMQQQQQQQQEPHSGAGEGGSLLDVNMLIGAREFQRHGKSEGGMQGGSESLSLDKLACLEGYMTQRPSSQPQPTPGPFIVGGVTVGRSSNPHSALDAITRQSSSSSSQRLQSQRRLLRLGASQSSRDLGPRTAAASAAAAAGAAAIAALDSSCGSSEQANGQVMDPGMRKSNSLLGMSALSALARSTTPRTGPLAQSSLSQRSALLDDSDASRRSAPEPCQSSTTGLDRAACSVGYTSSVAGSRLSDSQTAAALDAASQASQAAAPSPAAGTSPTTPTWVHRALSGAAPVPPARSRAAGVVEESAAAGTDVLGQKKGGMSEGQASRGPAEPVSGRAAEKTPESAGPRGGSGLRPGPGGILIPGELRVIEGSPGIGSKRLLVPTGMGAEASPHAQPTPPQSQIRTPQHPAGQPSDLQQQQQQQEDDEWEVANQQRLLELMANGASDIQRKRAGLQGQPTPAIDMVSYHEAFIHFMTLPLDERKRASAEELLPPPPGFLARLMCMATPNLKPLFREQQIRLLCLAREPFAEEDPMHLKLLQSLYACYTGKVSVAAPRFGSHWGEVGFQGTDPATDLRGCGMLGLLQLAYLHQHSPSNAAHIHGLATNPNQEFPMAIVSINITKFVLQALRSGVLNAPTNELGSAMEAANLFYVGTFYTFYDMWLGGNKTMLQSGYVIKELQILSQKKPKAMIAAAQKSLH